MEKCSREKRKENKPDGTFGEATGLPLELEKTSHILFVVICVTAWSGVFVVQGAISYGREKPRGGDGI
jgi:hypothetical protein